MKNVLRTMLPAVALLAATTLAQAQTQQQDHQVHHQAGQSAQSAPADAATPTPRTGMATGMGSGMGTGMGTDRGMMGMMGGGSMGPGMMQQMHGGSDGMPMMPMMMRGGMGMPFEHIEGRIAFLKAEIGITDEQQRVWDDFAAALRQNAEAMRTMHQGMAERMQQATKSWPGRIEAMAGMMTARADALNGIAAAARPLYDALSEEQRGKADSLLNGPMGMM